jgi:hypothetical protein
LFLIDQQNLFLVVFSKIKSSFLSAYVAVGLHVINWHLELPLQHRVVNSVLQLELLIRLDWCRHYWGLRKVLFTVVK